MRPCECSPIVIRFERCAAVFALALFSAPLSVWAQAAPAPPAVSLDRTTLPAKGKQAAILTVARPGAYAVTVKSPQGTSLQLVDRMTGPQAIQGRAGESDGRLDLLLKQGEYKIVARSHERGQGAAVLRVHPLLEKNAPPPLLVELKDVATTLEDFEQRSYWLKLDVRQRVILEAAGRHLDNLRLWKDGAWLIDAETENQIAQPRIGKPLRVCRLTADLEPGLYLLTAYGAAGQVWSQDDGARPLYIRYGLPRAGAAGRTRSEISPFGYDRVLVPGPTNYFRIELPEARPAALVVGRFDADAPFGTEGERAEVTKKSVPPAADMTVDGLETYAWHVATISGEAGQPYVLQHFVERWEYSFGGQGDYWIGSVHSGTAEDSFDATAILVDREQNVSKPRITPMADRAIVLDRSTSYARRANLLDSATLFFNIRDTGTYEIVATGVKARFRFEPFLLNLPPRYQAPPLGASGSTWDLDAGLYVLTMLPIEKGILNLTVRPKGLIAAALDTVGAARVNAQTQGAVRFERVTLDPTHHYTVFLSRQPEVHAGLIVRELPLDLGDALFVAQAAGETVNVSFKAAEAGALVAMAEDGKSLELSIDNGAWQASPVVSAGRHSVAVRHDRGTSVPYALRFAPTRLSRQAALPAIPQTELDALPKLPVLKPAETVFLDLKRESAASYMLPVEKPGLYRIESSGLLALSGNLRSRTVTSLFRAANNGVGRNFLIQGYLGSGDYLVTLATHGQSAGHLGLSAQPATVMQGGFITNARPARISLLAGQAVEYNFIITQPARFRLRALDLGGELRCRLEDQDGWPIVTPGSKADLTRDFEAGRYRFIVLPEARAMRVLTRIDPVAAPRRLIGHGPHKLTLARRYEHVWLEPEGKAARTPDTWQFDLPAAAEVNIELTGEMQADIVSVAPENKTVSIAKVPPQRGYRGTLPRGRYLLQVSAARQNNRAPYTVAVWPTVLMAGMERSITTPATIPVAVGQAGLVTFASFGMVDTRARLLDSSGLTVAANDDRPNDWNFYIGDVLMPGAYTLTVDSATGDNGSSVVSMRAPSEVLEPALALPDTREIKPGQATRIYPLTMAQDTHLLSFDASSKESIGLALEAERDGQVVVLAAQTGQQVSLAVPIERRPGEQAPRNLRLRLFSLDQRGSPVTLKAHALAPAAVSESELEKGVVLAAAQERGAPAARRVAIARPGLFAVEAAAASLRVCTAYGAPCAPVAGVARATLPTPLAIIGTGGERIRARRVVMTPPSSAAVAITDGRSLTVDVRSRTEGPLVVRAFARTGQPGVVIMKDAGNDPKAPLAMAIGDHAALAVRLKTRAAAARIYAASGPTASFDAEVLANSFAAPVAQSASFGVLDVAVPGEQARAFAIPGAPQRVHLALGADLVAVLSRGDEIESVHWGDDGNTAITTAAQADRLTLLNLNKTAARAAIELLPAKDELTERTIAAGHPVETRHVTAGVERVAVAAPFDAAGVTTLHVRGAELPPTFVGGDGSVRRGTDIRLGAGERGMLLIPHGVGTTLAWLDSAGKEAEGLWAVGQAPAARDVTLPAVVALQGEAQAFRVQAKSPLLLHARTDAPVVTALTRPAQEPSVDIHARGGTFDAYLPAGGSLLTLRALNNAQLSGTLELSATAVTPIDEGGSAEVLLAAGSARIFSFTVERKGAVGLGVRASADVVETILMNASGREIARGTNQMLTLDPGTYLLALRLPADTAPVTASPKVVGLKLPDTGPPPDVVERYVAQEKASAVFTARAAEAEASESEGVATDEESAGDGEEGVSEEDAPPSEETTDETQGGGRP